MSLDPRWTDALRRHAEVAPTPEAWAAIEERAGDRVAGDPAHRPGRRPWLLAAAAAVVVALALAAVVAVRAGDEDEGVRTEDPPPVLPTPGDPVRVVGDATVLESPEHGPEACFGAIQESYPPQCGGLPLVGWDWGAVGGEESANDTTWGSYRLTGDYDGERLVVTGPPGPPDPTPDEPPDLDLSTPCPEPPGGWVVRDPGRLTPEDRGAVQAALEADPEYGLMYMDRSIPVGGTGNERGVLNATFTGDLDRHRAEIEAMWGGPVCVSATDVARADLQRASQEILPPDGSERPLVVDGFRLRVLGVGSGNARQELQVDVEFAPAGAEAALAERLGVPVRLIPALRPTG